MTNENVTLPLLPLTSGVVLPGMVFTMALESDEARAAVEAARSAGGRLLLVPHIEGRYASVGVIAEVWRRASCPAGCPPWPSAVTGVPPIGTGVPGTGDALWVEVEPARRARADRRPPPSWPASTGPCSRTSCSAAVRGRIAGAAARGHRARAAWPTCPGYSPDLSLTQKVEVLETVDVEARLRLVLGWARTPSPT